jgi:hypothetical protein
VGQRVDIENKVLIYIFVFNYYKKLFKESIMTNNNSPYGSELLKISVAVMI